MAFSAVVYGIPELLRDIRLRAPISGETNVTLWGVASLICVAIAIYGYWLINQSLKRWLEPPWLVSVPAKKENSAL